MKKRKKKIKSQFLATQIAEVPNEERQRPGLVFNKIERSL